jgi:5'-nucleotidase
LSRPDLRRLRICAIVAALALPLSVPSARRAPPQARPVTVQLLAINDFHGNIEPPAGADGQINGTPAGGAAYLAAHLARAERENPNSIVVAAGDLVGASPLVSSSFHDEPTIAAMNAMHLAISSVGNHEFDRGIAEMLRLKRGGCHPTDGCQGGAFTGAAFQYLSANVVRTSTGATLFPPTAVRTIGGVKVAFIGETLQGTPDIVTAAATRGVTFLDEATTANMYAAQLTRQGVHAIVLLMHQGGRQQPGNGSPDPNGCDNFEGPIVPLVAKLTPDIQVVLSGHSHNFYNCRIGDHLVTSASAFGRMLTRVNLQIDRASDRIEDASAINEVVTRDVDPDPAVARLVNRYATLAGKTANRVVGSVSATISRFANPAGESALGDVIADAQLEATSAPGAGGAVVAFMNAGGIRADVTANDARPFARPGEVTFADLFRVQPFGNVMMTFTMTGEGVSRLLEQQFDNPRPGARSMLQVSNGFTYRYRLSAPPGQHIVADSVAISGRVIGPTDRVRVEATDFLVNGGGSYPALAEGTDRVVGAPDIDALVAYFKAHSPVAPGTDPRGADRLKTL